MLLNEARKLLIQALEKTHNAREVAENFSVNRGTVYRLKRQLEETGSIETRTYPRGRKSALSREGIRNIEQLLKEKPDITIAEIIDTLQLKACNETVRKAVLKLGYRRKKKSLHASEQEYPRCSRKRKNWSDRISEFKVSNLVFLDESGYNTDMIRRYAYSLGGSGAVDSVPPSKSKNTTILSSIQMDGTLHCTYFFRRNSCRSVQGAPRE